MTPNDSPSTPYRAIAPLDDSDPPIEPPSAPLLSERQCNVLLLAAAVSSACGLAIELLLGTLASYLVGNQALSYGVAVGGFLAAMGLGSYLSQFILSDDEPSINPNNPGNPKTSASAETARAAHLLTRFVQVELAIAPLSALLPLGLFGLFVLDQSLWLGLILVTMILGTLAGLEVPLLTRIIERDRGLKDSLARILALDYVGALFGSIACPVLLLPVFGMFPTAVMLGSLPALMVFAIGQSFPSMRRWRWWGLIIAAILWAIAPLSVPLGNLLENTLYNAPIVSRIQTPYQRIVLTRGSQDARLYIDGELQFSTIDEYRYHEALIHPALAASGTPTGNPKHVLLMGAGDGLALREILKWSSVDRVLLLELDPAIVKLARRYPLLSKLHGQSFDDPRVEIRYGDAFSIAPKLNEQFDTIIADFPDPDRNVIAKLYSEGFYQRLRSRLAPNGVFVTQASSPFFAPRAFACVETTLKAAEFITAPYTVSVPSFGPWGFVLASDHTIDPASLAIDVPTRFLNAAALPAMFALPKDVQGQTVEVNRLARPIIVKYQADRRWELY